MRGLWADWQLVSFDAPDLARSIRPGQFALARDTAGSTFDPYLRRLLWLYDIEGNSVSFLVSARDPLAKRAHIGDVLDLLAPLGCPLIFESSAKHILLIGQHFRLMPLLAIAHEQVKLGRAVVVVTNEESFPAHLLAPEVELRREATVDAELLVWADAVVASGAEDDYRLLGDAIRAARLRIPPGFAHVMLETAMPCGTGACYACAVETARGIRLACVDGPALDLLLWEKRMP